MGKEGGKGRDGNSGETQSRRDAGWKFFGVPDEERPGLGNLGSEEIGGERWGQWEYRTGLHWSGENIPYIVCLTSYKVRANTAAGQGMDGRWIRWNGHGRFVAHRGSPACVDNPLYISMSRASTGKYTLIQYTQNIYPEEKYPAYCDHSGAVHTQE